MKRFIGVDPGSTGSIAMIPEEGDIEIYPLENDILKQMCQAWQFMDMIRQVLKKNGVQAT